MICDFCYRHCDIVSGRPGFCGRREAQDGALRDAGYGEVVAFAVDPVEKKPLYHFLPGSKTVSIAMAGCNLACDFCQNWQLAQERSPHGERLSPESVVQYAKAHQYPSISYTYSEPLVWQDYMLEVACLASKEGLRNIMVSNGSFSKEALARILPMLDAYNIDLKGDEAFYRDICHGTMAPVVEGLRAIVGYGSHVEVTTMVIEGVHTVRMMKSLGSLLSSIGVQVWHLSRFFPRYRMSDRQATSEEFLGEVLEAVGGCGVPFVYPGNSALPAPTVCPGCGCVVRKNPGELVPGGVCPYCGRHIPGIWV